jgi:hypothetical protein
MMGRSAMDDVPDYRKYDAKIGGTNRRIIVTLEYLEDRGQDPTSADEFDTWLDNHKSSVTAAASRKAKAQGTLVENIVLGAGDADTYG